MGSKKQKINIGGNVGGNVNSAGRDQRVDNTKKDKSPWWVSLLRAAVEWVSGKA